MSEMVFARQLIRGNPIEKTRLRRAANERLYGTSLFTSPFHLPPCHTNLPNVRLMGVLFSGFQVATNAIDEGITASNWQRSWSGLAGFELWLPHSWCAEQPLRRCDLHQTSHKCCSSQRHHSYCVQRPQSEAWGPSC